MGFKNIFRHCTKKDIKKWYKNRIENCGYYYDLKAYNLLISNTNKLKVGDVVYNPYKFKEEKIKKIIKHWEMQFRHKKHFIIRYEIVTETGYIIYNLCEKPPEEIINEQKKIMEEFNREI